MLFLGHIGITAFVSSMIYLSALGGIIGVLLPDIIDKGLFILGHAPCSRFIAHSIFFFPVAGVVTYAITRNKKLALAVALGAFLHLLQDMHDNVPFLYPLKDYAFFDTCKQIEITFTKFVIVTELIGGSLFIFVFRFSRRFIEFRRSIWKFINNLTR
ncbi:MAG: metal-dependent hydrolase [Candidatus Aenigmarchaeota archaeon]|nr:metal-dependent hydrolase [Candidatus Aenigmarchaeota archaeon]